MNPFQIIYADGTLIDSKKVSKQPPYGPEGTFRVLNLMPDDATNRLYFCIKRRYSKLKYGVLTDSQYGPFFLRSISGNSHVSFLIKKTKE
jgi:hypothetical protein